MKVNYEECSSLSNSYSYEKFIFFFLLISCSHDDSAESYADTQDTSGYAEIICGIHSLNESYGLPTTKGVKRDLVYQTADVLGANAGRWIGSKVGATAGVVTANPVVGVVGYLSGREAGGVVGFVVASAVAKKV